jgi:hypothetical protein
VRVTSLSVAYRAGGLTVPSYFLPLFTEVPGICILGTPYPRSCFNRTDGAAKVCFIALALTAKTQELGQ